MNWPTYYRTRLGNRYANYCSVKYAPFINMIKDTCAKNIVEEGCGIGTISKIIGNNTCFDIDNGMLDLAALNGLHAQKKLITEHVEFDLLISHGVLEHLSDEVIQTVIKRGGKQIHYVPSNFYLQASYGDERLLSATEWKQLFQPDNIIEFNNCRDLILIWN